MHELYWNLGKDNFHREILDARAKGLGWGEIAKRYNMNKSNLRRLVLKILSEKQPLR